MKKYIALTACAVILTGFVACKKNPESEAKALFSDMNTLMDTYTAKLADSKTGKDAGKVLTECAEKFKALNTRAKDLEKKFPDFKFNENPAIKAEGEKLQASMQKFITGVMGAAVKYSQDKDFQDAMQKMTDSMKQ
jgi:hypothetical protein